MAGIFSEAGEVATVSRVEWETRAKNLLRAELRRRGITYKALAERLREVGLQETDRNISNKIGRGGFSAVFLLQCLHVIGATQLQLTD
jgi:hypothetical protein